MCRSVNGAQAPIPVACGALDLAALWIPITPVLNSIFTHVGLRSVRLCWKDHWTRRLHSPVPALPLNCCFFGKVTFPLSGLQFHWL